MASFNLQNQSQQAQRNQEATVYIGNLDTEHATETLVWELMLQAGPVVNVHLPKDRVTMSHQGFGFVEYMSEEDADYVIKIMNMVKLFGKPIKVNKATADKKELEIGASLFIGNLDPDVDEKTLYDTFSAFGVILQTPKIARDPDTGLSKGYGFVSYDNFDSSDAAIEAMNSQFLANKPITVSYAFKKDGKGERHGSAAERLLAAQAVKNNPTQLPNRLFADIPTPADPAAVTPAAAMPMAGFPIPGYPMPNMVPQMAGFPMPGYPMPGMAPMPGMPPVPVMPGMPPMPYGYPQMPFPTPGMAPPQGYPNMMYPTQ